MRYDLGEPFFEEDKIRSQKDLGGNRREAAYSANGAVKSDIEVTNTGSFVGISKGIFIIIVFTNPLWFFK
jgi:hypothetical protein